MVKIAEGAFAQVGSVVDNLFKAEPVLARLKDLVKTVRVKWTTPRSGQSLKNFFNLPSYTKLWTRSYHLLTVLTIR